MRKDMSSGKFPKGEIRPTNRSSLRFVNSDLRLTIKERSTPSTPSSVHFSLMTADGHVVSRGIYPSREMLNMWTGGGPAQVVSLPIAEEGCCSGSTGCC